MAVERTYSDIINAGKDYGNATEVWNMDKDEWPEGAREVANAFYAEIVRLEYALMEAMGVDSKTGHRGVQGPAGIK